MVQDSAYSGPILERLARLPDCPGVYLFKDARGKVLYVGKAISLRKRVGSYFRRLDTSSPRIAQMVRHVSDIEVKETTSEAEALLLEAELIKKLRPRYNVMFRDDKAYPLLKLTDESFARMRIVRRRQSDGARYFGPYPDAGLMHEAVQFLQRVFPLRTCAKFPKAPCLEYHLGQCLAPCVGRIDATGYKRIVGDLVAFLSGERDQLLRELSQRMEQASCHRRYEEAARLRNQLQALTSIIVAKEKSLTAGPLEQLKVALKLQNLPLRIEAFDISNIFGEHAVGSMVVFVGGKPHKAHYRRFRIETVKGIDDYRMMREIIHRRYGGDLAGKLPLPDLIVVDGGKGQLSSVCKELSLLSLDIPAIGLAKRFEHIFLPGLSRPVVLLRTSPVLHLIQYIRDEAHRFAITYHRALCGKGITASTLREIPGIGPRRAKRLLVHFGSVRRLARAQPDKIARVAGISERAASEVAEYVRRPAVKTFRIAPRRNQ